MRLDVVRIHSLPLQRQLQWIAAVDGGRFLTGDDRQAFELDPNAPDAIVPVDRGPTRAPWHPCTLPLPDRLLEAIGPRFSGLSLLTPAEYDQIAAAQPDAAGDLLRTWTGIPNQGTAFRHAGTGAVLALRRGRVELLDLVGESVVVAATTRTRGRTVFEYGAAPRQGLLAYGDNHGDFFLQEFSREGFGKSRKLGSWVRTAGAVLFDDDESLVVGGTGYLVRLRLSSGKPAAEAGSEIAVREAALAECGRVVVNQGLNGIAVYRQEGARFTAEARLRLPFSVNRMAVSPGLRSIAVTAQASADTALVSVE